MFLLKGNAKKRFSGLEHWNTEISIKAKEAIYRGQTKVIPYLSSIIGFLEKTGGVVFQYYLNAKIQSMEDFFKELLEKHSVDHKISVELKITIGGKEVVNKKEEMSSRIKLVSFFRRWQGRSKIEAYAHAMVLDYYMKHHKYLDKLPSKIFNDVIRLETEHAREIVAKYL